MRLEDLDTTNDLPEKGIATKGEIGFAISILGYAFIAVIFLVVVFRSTRVNDPTLDGTEQFAEAIGQFLISALWVFAAFLIALVCGSIGAHLGSLAGKVLLILSGLSATIFLFVLILASLF